MVSRSFTIKNKMGMHMRPANVFVTAMTKYNSDVFIIHNGQRINAKSIMNIMASCIKYGANITVECSGDDENEMMIEVEKLITDGFGEE